MGKQFKKIGQQIFAFLSSVQLAVVTLIILAMVLAVGTYVESLQDAEAAKYYVYSTPWFVGLLGLLGLNVLFAGLSRWPWKKKHIGFLVVHLGIIVVLVGSFITLFKGFEGQVVLQEGSSTQNIYLPTERQLLFLDANEGDQQILPAQFRFDPPAPDDPMAALVLENVLVKVDDFMPNAQSEEIIEEGQGLPNPALKIQIKGSQAEMEEWVFSREYGRRRLSLGPASITYLETPNEKVLQEILQDPKMRGPILVADEKVFRVNQGLIGEKIPLQNKTLIVRRLFSHAGVMQGKLMNLSTQARNPMVQLEVIGPNQEKEVHEVYSSFPEITTHREKKISMPLPFRMLVIPENLGNHKNELLLARTKDGRLFYALFKGQWSELKPVELNQAVATGWMDFQFKILEEVQVARSKRVYHRLPSVPGQSTSPAVHLVVKQRGTDLQRDFWLGLGRVHRVNLPNRSIQVAYDIADLDLGFEMSLEDFKMGTYQGTNNPSSYESHVTYQDPKTSEKKSTVIAMNQPLKAGGLKLFQADYRLNPEGKDLSVFVASYDPGVWVKNIGSLILVLGIILIFYFKRTLAKSRAKRVKFEQTVDLPHAPTNPVQ